jgi:hypothetical protein
MKMCTEFWLIRRLFCWLHELILQKSNFELLHSFACVLIVSAKRAHKKKKINAQKRNQFKVRILSYNHMQVFSFPVAFA